MDINIWCLRVVVLNVNSIFFKKVVKYVLNKDLRELYKTLGGKTMKFCWSTITVNNMEESLEFYKEIVGLKENRRFQAAPGVEITFLGEGETQIELVYYENKKEGNIGSDISLGFEVNSIDEMMEFIKGKGRDIDGPYQPNPHLKFFYVLDPNGLKIQFVETI